MANPLETSNVSEMTQNIFSLAAVDLKKQTLDLSFFEKLKSFHLERIHEAFDEINEILDTGKSLQSLSLELFEINLIQKTLFIKKMNPHEFSALAITKFLLNFYDVEQLLKIESIDFENQVTSSLEKISIKSTLLNFPKKLKIYNL